VAAVLDGQTITTAQLADASDDMRALAEVGALDATGLLPLADGTVVQFTLTTLARWQALLDAAQDQGIATTEAEAQEWFVLSPYSTTALADRVNNPTVLLWARLMVLDAKIWDEAEQSVAPGSQGLVDDPDLLEQTIVKAQEIVAAISEAAEEQLSAMTVNPRYGTYDPQIGAVVLTHREWIYLPR
jgi:hypothetical protein